MLGKYRPLGAVLAALMGICLIVGNAMAQVKSSSITGIVTDASGAVVPDAAVVVTNEQTNVSVESKSDRIGEYTVPYLETGRYSVTVTQKGFETYRKTGIIMGTATTVRVDVALVTGTVATTVEVQASSAALQTENATVQAAVNTNIIESIPNINNNPLYYASLEAGIVPDAKMYGTHVLGVGFTDRQAMSDMRINGSEMGTDDVQLDGLSVQGSAWHETAVVPDRDALEEVRVTTNSFAADLGYGQGLIAMTTKSGTNQFHGSLDYYLRNEALNAAGMLNNQEGIKKPVYRLNEGGGTIGGPVIIPKLFNGKDRLFFFADFTRLTHSDPVNLLTNVPTDLERVGNFNGTMVPGISGQPEQVQVFNPFSVRPYNGSTEVFQRAPYATPNVITNPSPYGLALMKGYPEPNATPTDAFNDNNYRFTGSTPTIRNALATRLDWRLGQKNSIYATGGVSIGSAIPPDMWPASSKPWGIYNWPGVTADDNPYASFGDTITVSPTMVVDIRYGFTHIHTNSSVPDGTGFNYTAAGMPANVQTLIDIPGTSMVVNNFGGPINNLNNDQWDRKHEAQLNHDVIGSMTKVAGRWTFKAGADYRVDLLNLRDLVDGTPALGEVTENSTAWLSTINGSSSTLITDPGLEGIDYATFLTGVGGYNLIPGCGVKPAIAAKDLALFSQNDWKVTSKLTINLGLRYEVQPGPTERYDRISALDLTKPNPYATGVTLTNPLGGMGLVAFPGTDGYSRNMWNTQYNNFQPRVGVAYRLRGDFVVRGGYGRSYTPSNSGFNSNGLIYGTFPYAGGSAPIPYGLTPNGAPIGTFDQPGNSHVTGGLGAVQSPYIYGGGPASIGVDILPRHFNNSYVDQWNFFVERSFGRSWMLSLGYVGSHGSDLPWRGYPLNGTWAIPNSTLQSYRAGWLASNGTADPAQVQIPNPLTQLAGLANGTIGDTTIPAIDAGMPYLALLGQTTMGNIGTSNYNSMQFTIRHAYSNGLTLLASYTWSKSTGLNGGTWDSTYAESQVGGQGTTNYGGVDYHNLNNDRGLLGYNIPQRLLVTVSYALPFGNGRALAPGNKFARAVTSDWRLATVVTMQSGEPWGPNCGGINGRCNVVPGESMYVPKSLQGWYNGSTKVTLPDGRIITPGEFTYLKYNPDYFAAPVVQFPNGQYSVDQYWYGQTAMFPNGLHTPRFSNVNLSVTRIFPIHENFRLELNAEATNAFNQTMFYPSAMNGGGGAVIQPDPATNTQVGMNSAINTGSLNNNFYYPREITLSVYLKF